MIEIRTGLPGSGKTLSAIDTGMQYVKEGRRVFADGIRDLNYDATGIQKYPVRIDEWHTFLQPGDVLIVDEVQRFLPKALTLRDVPAWVEEFTRNRHLGVDLIFVTQDALNVDTFVRRLVNTHRHFVNRFGNQESKVYTWLDGVHEPDKQTDKRVAETSTYKYPQNIYDVYTSADVHTRKKTKPKAIRHMQIGLVLMVILGGATVWIMHRMGSHGVAQTQAKSDAPSLLLPSSWRPAGDALKHVLTKTEYAARMVPRIDGVIWSEPLFDDRKAQSHPELYCMSVETGRCKCHSEQGTDVDIPIAACRGIALHGLYNPFREPLVQMLSSGQLVPQTPAESPQESTSESKPSANAGISKVSGRHPLREAFSPDVFRPKSSQY